MKNTIKIVCVLLLVVAFGCSESDGRFQDTPTSGWVSFTPPTASRTINSLTTEVKLPVSINVPKYPNGLNVSYTLQAVQGDYTSYVSASGNMYVEPVNDRFPFPTIDLTFSNLDNVGDLVIFDVVLQSVDQDGVTVGVDDSSITSYRITIPCTVDVGTVYNAKVYSTELGLDDTNNEAFDYTANITQLTANSWNIDSAWGPSFVANLTGNPIYVGQFLYPATLTLNSDGTVTAVGTSANRPGGTGTYDPCADRFVLNLTQTTFSGAPFGVTTVLTPQ